MWEQLEHNNAKKAENPSTGIAEVDKAKISNTSIADADA